MFSRSFPAAPLVFLYPSWCVVYLVKNHLKTCLSQLLVSEKTDSGPTTNAAGPSRSVPIVPPPDYAEHEQAWQGALRNLDTQISRYNQARQSMVIERNDGVPHATDIERETQEREAAVVEAINNVADAHPDPGVRTHWQRRAKEFKGATEKEKDMLIPDIMRAVMTLITTPLVLTGLVLITAGAILNGIGTALTGGRYRGKWRRKDRKGRGRRRDEAEEDLGTKD